jgi:tetratricopeptide (TPR) repeat protein
MGAATSHGVKEVVSSAAMECNEILPSTSEDEDVMHDEETEGIPVASEVGEAKSEESKEVVSRPVVQESSGTLSNNNLVETVELERCHLDRNTQAGTVNVETSKYEKTGEVPKPNHGEAQQEIDLSSMPKESFSAHALRLQGNKLFLHEDFRGATELYTRGILQAMKEQELTRSATSTEKSGVTNGHASESEVLLGFSNRAEAWIRLHEYEKGLEDAEKALALQHDHLKSLFRKGRALLGLHQYHDANLILRVRASVLLST